jgi:hypothetical protein
VKRAFSAIFVVVLLCVPKEAGAELPHVPFGYHDEFRGSGGALMGWPMNGSGASFGRITVEPEYPVPRRWPELNLALSTARAYGRGVLLAVYDRDGVPADARFADFVEALLRYVHGRGVEVVGLEVWNEPNIGAFGPLSAEHLVALCQRAREGADAARSRAQLIAGGLFLAGQTAWREYLRSYLLTIKEQTNNWLDLAVHPYAFGPPEEAIDHAIHDMRRAERIADGRDVWVTEMGFPAVDDPSDYSSQDAFRRDAWSEADQRRGRKRLYLEARRLEFEGFVWYRLQDELEDNFYGYGALHHDGSPKPVFWHGTG